MKLSSVTVGGRYVARVSGEFVTVRVTRIYQTIGFGDKPKTCLELVNERTGRRLSGWTAARLRWAEPKGAGSSAPQHE